MNLSPVPSRELSTEFLQFLRCPLSGEKLTVRDGALVTQSSSHSYRIGENGIACFAEEYCSIDARRQESHYDAVSSAFIENLGYSHTREYLDYLDRALVQVVDIKPVGIAAEICCGTGEAFLLFRDRIQAGIGVDVSTRMLAAAQRKFMGTPLRFVQGDATMMPLESGVFDTVFMLGGIHHVNDRRKLFGEVHRILKPGGRFIWREPLSDFWLWRLLRAIIYRISPMLDHQTERPLLYRETVPVLESAGMALESWHTIGFLGFCLFMNSDVLYFNRFFRFVPGIRAITLFFVALDDAICRVPGMRRSGLIVVGAARKPA